MLACVPVRACVRACARARVCACACGVIVLIYCQVFPVRDRPPFVVVWKGESPSSGGTRAVLFTAVYNRLSDTHQNQIGDRFALQAIIDCVRFDRFSIRSIQFDCVAILSLSLSLSLSLCECECECVCVCVCV